jgi:hypothetical protein
MAPLPGPVEPPRWDEPGPCDCGVAPDLCAMKRFRLVAPDGRPWSDAPGADSFRQLSASLVDLERARRAAAVGVRPGDRVLVTRSPESRAALAPADLVLDGAGVVRRAGDGGAPAIGAVLQVMPWPAPGWSSPFRRAFSGLWEDEGHGSA